MTHSELTAALKEIDSLATKARQAIIAGDEIVARGDLASLQWTAQTTLQGLQVTDDVNRRKLQALFDTNVDLRTALKLCIPWLSRLIADGGHERCAAPQAAVNALAEARAAIAAAKAPTTPDAPGN